MNLLQNTKVTRISAAVVAGTTEISSSILDMAGFDGVMFIAQTGDVLDTSVLTLRAQGSNVANFGSGVVTLVGNATFTAGATNADSRALLLDLKAPRQRYVRASFTRTVANAVVDSIIAIQYGAMNSPPVHDASVIAQRLISDPASV